MSTQTEAVNSVNGAFDYTERRMEIAKANGIQFSAQEAEGNEPLKTEEINEEPKGEVETNVEQENQATENTNTEVVDDRGLEDPFAKQVSQDEEVSDEDSKDSDSSFEGYPKGFSKQLKRKDRAIGRMKDELEQIKEQLAQYQQSATQAQTQRQNQPVTKENFKSEAEYIDYMVQQRLNATLGEYQKQANEQAQQNQQYTELATSWDTKVTNNIPEDNKSEYQEAIASLGDIDKTFDKPIVEYMFGHDRGPLILKYFADRPELIPHINQMHEFDKSAALRNIAEYVSGSPVQSGSHPQQAQQVSKAKPVGGLSQNAAGTNVNSIDKMTDAERLAAYRSGKWNPFK